MAILCAIAKQLVCNLGGTIKHLELDLFLIRMHVVCANNIQYL